MRASGDHGPLLEIMNTGADVFASVWGEGDSKVDFGGIVVASGGTEQLGDQSVVVAVPQEVLRLLCPQAIRRSLLLPAAEEDGRIDVGLVRIPLADIHTTRPREWRRIVRFPEAGEERPDSHALADAAEEAQNVLTVTVSDASDGAAGGGNERGMNARLSAIERMLGELASGRRENPPERVVEAEPREGRARASEERRSRSSGTSESEEGPSRAGRNLGGAAELLQAFGRGSRADPLIAESVERRTRGESPLPARRATTGTPSARDVAGTAAPANANEALIQLLLLKELRGQKRGEEGETSSSGGDDLSGAKALKVATSYRMYTRLKKRRFKNPRCINRRFQRSVMERLGAEKGDSWKYHDFWKKVNWRNFRSMGRSAWILLEIIQLCSKASTQHDLDVVQATAVQGVKALHQFALDGG